jgi:aminoglycoside phosphotransferase (APT) family kinase protein
MPSDAPVLDEAALGRLGAWFAREVPCARGPLSAELIPGGKSNLTYRVRDSEGRQWALRRPPSGPTAPTAHDVIREHRIIAALHAHSSFPVPTPIGTCEDETVIGARFMVTGYVDGIVLRNRTITRQVPENVRAVAAQDLVDVLAHLHELHPKKLELDGLAPPGDYLERQLSRWRKQYEWSRGRDVPDIETMHGWLSDHLPPPVPPRVVHGDYRLDNAVFDAYGRVVAVLDWEVATLGDPLADLALLVVYWAGEGPEAVGPTALPGFPDRAAVIERYATVSGRDPGDLRWYLAFSYWKLACLAETVHARYAAGGGGGDRSVRPADVAKLAPTFAARARAVSR